MPSHHTPLPTQKTFVNARTYPHQGESARQTAPVLDNEDVPSVHHGEATGRQPTPTVESPHHPTTHTNRTHYKGASHYAPISAARMSPQVYENVASLTSSVALFLIHTCPAMH
jgi:hypothetical protein